jgi:L-lactate dehydrogenase complex protein LldG
VELFAERVADYRAVVVRCTDANLATRLVEAVEGCARVLVPTDLSVELRPSGPVIVEDHLLGVTDLGAVGAVVTTTRLGIAETGTIVLDHRSGQGRRAATLIPDRHVCAVRAEQVVATVTDAGRGTGPVPSADLDQRAERHQRHRAGPRRGRARAAHPARAPARVR